MEQPHVNGVPVASQGSGWRQYWQDALGRTTGTTEWECIPSVYGEGGPGDPCQWGALFDLPGACRYDPLNRMFDPCQPNQPFVGYDGENVIGTSSGNMWMFVHGPGLDDPLMGYYYASVPGNDRRVYFVTDGQGRQFGVGDTLGYNFAGENAYLQDGGKLAGGTRFAASFSASRHSNPQMYQLSFFRNRFYDQNTGRWTQEDPIGIAGGVNLYQYVGNNPLTFTDPFGLCTKEDGWKDCREATKEEGVAILTAGFNEMASYKKSGITYGMPPVAGKTQDCSHFYCASANRAGLNVDYRNTTAMAGQDGFKLIDASEARAGDVIMRPGHVGIYIGQKDRQGRYLALDMGQRSPDYTKLLSNWGPGSTYGNSGPITFYRPMVPTTQNDGN